MTASRQPRATAITRCIAALAVSSFTACSLAQSTATTQPAPAIPQPAASQSTASQSGKSAQPSKQQLHHAEEAYLAGARAIQHNDFTSAEIQFQKAVALNPTNQQYALALASTHEHRVNELINQAGKARLLGNTETANALLAEARLLDPDEHILGHQNDGNNSKLFHPEIEPWIREAPSLAGAITLEPNNTTQNFHLNTGEQEVLRSVLSSYGIKPVFDDSVQRQTVRFDLEDAPYQQAVPILLEMTHLFAVPLDAKSVLIAKDTPENRLKFEHLLQETIFIPGMTNEQMDELGNVVRNVFDIKQVSVEKSSGSLVLRAPEDTLSYINLTLADMIDGGSEVMVELKLYAVDKSNQRNIGAQLPQQVGIYNVAGAAQNLVSQNQTLVNQAIAQGLIPASASNIEIALALIASGLVQSALLSSTLGFFGGGLTATGVTINQNPTFNLALTASQTRALNDIQLRVGDRQTATFRVGERYPITTATYSSGLTSSQLAGVSINGVSASSLLNTASTAITIPQIQYEDLGLTLKATPTVQKSGAIRLHLELKIEALTGGALDNIPVLNSQQFVSDITVDDGDTAMMASSVTKSTSDSLSGLTGISELPGFQTATGDTTTNSDTSELVLLVTPHITRRRSNITAGPRIAVNLPEPPG